MLTTIDINLLSFCDNNSNKNSNKKCFLKIILQQTKESFSKVNNIKYDKEKMPLYMFSS